jgi:drug/metabolite transporter (DMT)-like permease
VSSDRLLGVTLVVLSAAGFGALGVLARVAYDDGADPVAVLTARFGLAALCFVAVRLLRPAPRPPTKALLGLVAMGFGYLFQSLCYFSALKYAPPGLVALLLYSFPVMVVALGAVVLHLHVTRRVAVACAVAVAGLGVVIGPSAGSGEPLGVAFGLGAALVYSGYILLGSRVLEHVDALWASTVIMSTAAVGFLVVYLLTPHRPSFPTTGGGWAAVVAIALVCTVFAGMTFLAGLHRVGPADASTLSTVEPVVSVVLSAIVIGEAVNGWTLVGGAMVLGAVVAISRSSESPRVDEGAALH